MEPDRSLVRVPSPERLRDLIERYGSPLTDSLVPGFVPPVSAVARDEALERGGNPPRWLLEQEGKR